MKVLLILSSRTILVASFISLKDEFIRRSTCSLGIRDNFFSHAKYGVNVSGVEDNIPRVLVAENVSYTKISSTFHVKPFVLWKTECQARDRLLSGTS